MLVRCNYIEGDQGTKSPEALAHLKIILSISWNDKFNFQRKEVDQKMIILPYLLPLAKVVCKNQLMWWFKGLVGSGVYEITCKGKTVVLKFRRTLYLSGLNTRRQRRPMQVIFTSPSGYKILSQGWGPSWNDQQFRRPRLKVVSSPGVQIISLSGSDI